MAPDHVREPAAGRRRPTALLGALGLSAALLLAACTSDNDANTPSPAPAPTSATPSGGSSKAVPTPASTPVPPPTPGGTSSTVPTQQTPKRKPVALEATGKATDAVRVRLVRVDPIRAEAKGPGEVAGPALALTIEVDNAGDQRLDLGTAVVNLTGSDGSPGSIMSASPAKPFPAAARARSKVRGVYVFTVAPAKRNPVTVEVAVSAQDPLVVFRGRAAR